jgi:lipopolysaccharide/colanic/teichoic acid biosynthesis glycosyltransferase
VRERLRVKPGITGMWQVSGRSDSSFDEYARLDLYYVHNWSLLVDLGILARTIPTVLWSKGAY